MRGRCYIVPIMSNRASTAPGKAFLWLIAVAIAILVEGALLSASAWFPHDTYAMKQAPNLEEVGADPGVEVDATRIIRFVATAIDLARASR